MREMVIEWGGRKRDRERERRIEGDRETEG